MRFVGDDYVIDLALGIITKHGTEITLRAKTLQVLALLLAQRGQTVSKTDMLAQIWTGLVVQEQVLVQSVKELRDALGPTVIRTYPKQGYRWVAAGQLDAPAGPVSCKPLSASAKRPLLSWRNAGLLTAGLCILLLFCLWLWWRPAPVKAPHSIAVLPVLNLLKDPPYQAVSLEGQQYLINALQAAEPVKSGQWQLLPADQLAHLLALLPGTALAQLNQGDVFRLRQQLTTDVIVSTRLLGYPQDLQLQYELSLPYSTEKGVVFAATVEACFSKLADVLAQRFALKLAPAAEPVFSQDLTNASLVAGINYYLQADFANAVALLSSSLVTAPHLLAARRYLASSYANLGQRQQAIDLLQQGLAQQPAHTTSQQADRQQDRQQDREWYRTALLLGVLLAEQASGKPALLAQSELQLQQALALAGMQQDLLFQTFALEELARVKRLQQQYAAAEQHLQQALALHQQLAVPYGQTNTLIELAHLAVAQQQWSNASQYLAQAWQIALTYQASANQVWVLLAQAELAELQSPSAAAAYIATAQQVAGHSQDKLLQQRVSRWQQHKGSRLFN